MLIATWEPSWGEEGLGDPAVHVALDDAADRAELETWVGRGRDVPDARGLVRFAPELDLATFAALLARAGLTIEDLVSGLALRAMRTGQG